MKTKAHFLAGLIFFILVGCSRVSSPLATPTPKGGAFAASAPVVIKTCTVVGCGKGLVVNLQGKVPEDFTVEVTTAAGEHAQAHCVRGRNAEGSGPFPSYHPICYAGQLYFFGYTPDELDLTARWGEQVSSQHLKTTIVPFYPNGTDCPPLCQKWTAAFAFPE